MLENRQKWAKSQSCPILVVAFRNDTLDQFLCHFLGYTNKIVRIGAGSQEEKLAPYNLRNYRSTSKFKLSKMKGLDQLKETLNLTKRKLFEKSGFTFENFLEAFPLETQKKFQKEMPKYFLNFEIEFKKKLHPQSIEKLFQIWKDSKIISPEKFNELREWELKNNENHVRNPSKIQNLQNQQPKKVNFMEKSIISEENLEDCESDGSEEMDDLDVFNQMTEKNVYNKEFDVEGDFYFYSMTEEQKEGLAKCEFFVDKNIWDLNSKERETLIQYYFLVRNSKSFQEYQEQVEEFLKLTDEIEDELLENDLKILKQAKIVGITVNILIIYRLL